MANPSNPNPPFSSVDPSAHLPRLSAVAQMEPPERRAALALWITWFNTHRERVEPELERELDRSLIALDRTLVQQDDMDALQNRFDQWLETAGTVGKGRGPAEDEAPGS